MAKKQQPDTFIADVIPCQDRSRHTVLKLSKSDDKVKYIPLDVVEGLKVLEMKIKDFDDTYKQIPKYPVDKACSLFLGYARTLGATKEVMSIFSTFINVTKEDVEVATGKRQVDSDLVPKKEKPAPKEKVKKETKPETDKKPAKPKGPSAAQMFRDLIMEGKKTDDEIFADVKEAYGLDDSKKTYVNWYRKKMTKDGLNPPGPVSEKPVTKPTKGKTKK